MSRVLVTGASGFVGRALCQQLAARGVDFVRTTRREDKVAPTSVVVGELADDVDWSTVLSGVDVVVHLAGRVHVMRDSAADPLAEFRRVNTQGTLNLARQAATARVRRFVFVSTVKVNGEGGAQAYTEDDRPAPQGAYARSKWEAECGLREIAADTAMEVVTVRPPLVYGPGVKANFLSMMRWIKRGLPLPLGAIHNQRSLVALDNLVDFLMVCATHPAAANQTFLVSDGEDLSTTQLLVRIAAALGRPARLLPVPVWVIHAGASLLGKSGFAQRLCGSLRVDIAKAKSLLGWSPPLSVEEGLRRVAEDFSVNRGSR